MQKMYTFENCKKSLRFNISSLSKEVYSLRKTFPSKCIFIWRWCCCYCCPFVFSDCLHSPLHVATRIEICNEQKQSREEKKRNEQKRKQKILSTKTPKVLITRDAEVVLNTYISFSQSANRFRGVFRIRYCVCMQGMRNGKFIRLPTHTHDSNRSGNAYINSRNSRNNRIIMKIHTQRLFQRNQNDFYSNNKHTRRQTIIMI